MSNEQAGVEATARWETWVNCFLLVLFIFFFFNLWETVHDRMFVERAASATGALRVVDFHGEYVAIGIVGIAVILAAWIARRPKQMWRFAASMRLAIVSITSILLGTVVGTLVFQNAQVSQYIDFYSEPLYAIFKALHFTDLFASWWFIAFTVLLAVNLVACTVHRKAWRPQTLGMLLIHGGIVVVIIGGFLGGLLTIKGGIALENGMSTDYVATKDYTTYEENRLARLFPQDIPENARQPLGFTLHLDNFEVLTYEDPYVVHVNKLRHRTDTNELVLLPEQTIKFDDKRPLTLEQGFGVLRIEKFYRNFRRAKAIEETADGRPLAEVVFYPAGHVPITNLVGEESLDKPVAGDAFNLRFAWELPADERLSELGIQREEQIFRLIAFDMSGERAKLELKLGEEKILEGTNLKVKLINFYNDLKAEKVGEEMVFSNASDQMLNPAVEVEVTGGEIGIETYILPFKIEQLMQGDLIDQSRKLMELMNKAGLMLRFDPAVELLLVGSTKTLHVFRPGMPAETVDLSAGPSYTPPFSNYSIVFGRMVESGAAGEGDVFVDDSPVGNFAVELVLKRDGEERRAVIEESDNIPDSEAMKDERYTLKLNDEWFVTLRIRGDYINDYRSHVKVLRDGEEQRTHTIRVNEPLIENGFYFYQNSYGQGRSGYFTYLTVSNDPGLPLVYLGLTMMIVGIIYAFYVKPRLKRSKAAKENDYVE
ncbi:MAG TPA: cytochrome c biogenesis protein ResB [Acidobacteriota bacterium]|nr:cytochrome c biogenesis protein ResB [Acidobacteriota bacterium]